MKRLVLNHPIHFPQSCIKGSITIWPSDPRGIISSNIKIGNKLKKEIFYYYE